MFIKTDPAIDTCLEQRSGGGLVTLVPLIRPHCIHSPVELFSPALLCAAGKADGLPEIPKYQVPVSPEHRGIINT